MAKVSLDREEIIQEIKDENYANTEDLKVIIDECTNDWDEYKKLLKEMIIEMRDNDSLSMEDLAEFYINE